MGSTTSNILYFVVLLAIHLSHGQKCMNPATMDFSIQKMYCEQPLFFNVLPKTEENMLLDNVCVTYFPLPDDPNFVVEFDSFVYCDGSNYVESFILTSEAKGINVVANPMATYRDFFIGYAGCDTTIGYRCSEFGDYTAPFIFGVSTLCSPLGLSCLRKVEEIIADSCLPQQDLYVLPMKLPNRCVTQRPCILPSNPFYNNLGPSVDLLY